MAPNQYAIGVAKNKFALCDSEEEMDPHELLKKQEKQKEEKKKAKVVEKSTAKPAKVGKPSGQASKPKQAADPARPRSLPPVAKRGGNFNERNQSGPRQDREETANVEGGDYADYRGDGSSGSESGAPDRARGERRGGFSRVFVRGGGRGRGGFDNGRKREFDRRSGSDKTGVKPVDKRRSSGSFNWGTAEDEFTAQVPQEEPKSPEGSQTAEQSDKVEANEPEKEEDQVVSTETEEKPALTLDEWKALKNSRPKPSYNIRKPGEGEDLTRWKDMVVLSKKDTDEEEDEEFEYGEYPQRVGRQKRLEIDVRFYDRRGRGGRGRGPPRGALPAAPRQPAPQPSAHRAAPAPAPRVDDEADFPSLV